MIASSPIHMSAPTELAIVQPAHLLAIRDSRCYEEPRCGCCICIPHFRDPDIQYPSWQQRLTRTSWLLLTRHNGVRFLVLPICDGRFRVSRERILVDQDETEFGRGSDIDHIIVIQVPRLVTVPRTAANYHWRLSDFSRMIPTAPLCACHGVVYRISRYQKSFNERGHRFIC